MFSFTWIALSFIIYLALPGVSFPFTCRSINTHRQHIIILLNSPNKMSEPPRRLARREIKKRRVRDGSSRIIDAKKLESDNIWETSEKRPLVRSKSIEAGTDYWMDERELQMSLEREVAVKNRKALEGKIPTEKLRTEIVTPYKQNWIGLMSVGIVILATIISQFPELLQAPIIPIPDL